MLPGAKAKIVATPRKNNRKNGLFLIASWSLKESSETTTILVLSYSHSFVCMACCGKVRAFEIN